MTMGAFRILRDREHRDGEDDLIAYAPPEMWDCPICSQGGNIEEFCSWCSARRGEWVCPDDGHKNPRESQECELCGKRRPRE